MTPPVPHHISWGERIIRRTPMSFIEYPLEVVGGVWALFAGVPVVFGWAAPQSIDTALPHLFRTLWGVALAISGLSILVGLRGRYYQTLVASGLQLMGSTFLCYAFVISFYAGFAARFSVSLLMLSLAVLFYWRALWLRVRSTILRNILEASD